jgi:23S rRNA pseudouridine1911/1915/1917 synthase
MEKRSYKISPEDAGMRIDKYLALKLGDEYSRTFVKNMMDKGLVDVNGSRVKPNYSTRQDDEVTALLPPPEPVYVDAEQIPIDIIHEDEAVIVINKPAGMVVHPGSGNKKGTMVSAVLFHCGKLADTGDILRPGIVHRLDKDTSGVIVVAKNDKAMRSLAKQFQNRTIKKRYLAIVTGKIEMDNGVIDAPLARHAVDRKKMDIEHSTGKAARTVYHVIRRGKGYTFVCLEPETGRTHQIRVHMKHIGHPIVGDAKYGGGPGMARQALHAERIAFTHPETGKTVEFEAPLPEDMKEFLREKE